MEDDEKEKLARLKKETVDVLNEINRIRTQEVAKDKKLFSTLMNKVKTRGLWTIDQEILFLAEFFLKHRKK